MEEDAAETVNLVAENSFEVFNAFEFSENELYSIATLDSKKYYDTFFHLMKYRNPRNDPAKVAEVQKHLMEQMQAFHAKL